MTAPDFFTAKPGEPVLIADMVQAGCSALGNVARALDNVAAALRCQPEPPEPVEPVTARVTPCPICQCWPGHSKGCSAC